MPALISVAEAIACVGRAAPLMSVEDVALIDASGRVLAEPVVAMRDQPPFAASAMDGYAVRADDLSQGLSLRVIGESQAGQGFAGSVGAGEAVRIFTGAPVPEGADAILIQEQARREDAHLEALPEGRKPVPAYIRPAGQDFHAGDELLAVGARLDAWRLTLAAAAGRDRLSVRRQPHVVVLCTGNELVAPGETPAPDQIYESASPALIALCEDWGATANFVGVEGDDLAAIQATLETVLTQHKPDLIVTVGGASVGDLDLVRPALDGLGLVRDFDSVKMRPGKPTAFGKLSDGTAVLILPGNPASALVMAQLLLKSWIEAALGAEIVGPCFVKAVLSAALPPAGWREAFLRGRLSVSAAGQLQVEAFSDQDSSLVSVFAKADVLVRLPADTPALPVGALVDVLLLQRY